MKQVLHHYKLKERQPWNKPLFQNQPCLTETCSQSWQAKCLTKKFLCSCKIKIDLFGHNDAMFGRVKVRDSNLRTLYQLSSMVVVASWVGLFWCQESGCSNEGRILPNSSNFRSDEQLDCWNLSTSWNCLLKWPCQTPDFNPDYNLCTTLKSQVHSREPTNLWGNVPRKVVKHTAKITPEPFWLLQKASGQEQLVKRHLTK